MKKNHFIILLFFTVFMINAQVGINTTDPKAQLEIKSSNEVTPTNTDGLLIPKINVFPATNPTIDQQGMLVYLKNVSGTNQPGFYYWNFGTLTWTPMISGTSGGTLDQSYDFGGAGLGKTITADAGPVLINGTDGFVSTGTIGVGAFVPAGSGSKMFWNPRKAAFRAGRINGAEWNDLSVGFSSVAFGTFNIADGDNSTSFGSSNNANGNYSTTFGQFNSSKSYAETVFGIGATDYTPTSETQFSNANATDRLFVIGNAIDLNNNFSVDAAERRDALVILKNGATGLGTALPEGILDVKSTNNGILIPRVSLTSALVQAPVLNPQTGNIAISTLVYNTAINGVSPNNVYPGFYYWNGAKWIRFDVGGENNPKYYTVVGTSQDFTTPTFTALEQMTLNFTPKDDTVLVNFSAAGFRFDDAFQNNVIFFQLTLNGIPVTGWQTASKQSIVDIPFSTDDITIWESNISYPITVPIGIPQTLAIQWSCPNSTINNTPNINFTAFGQVYKSYRSLTVIDPNGGGGIVGSPPVTTNLWALNGNTATNSLTNFVGTADNQPLVLKSNNLEGLRIATNSNVGLGTTNPLDKLHVVGNIRMVDGNQATGKVLTSDVNGTATWLNASANAWGLTGNVGTNATTNFIGTTDNADVIFKRNNGRAGLLGTSNTSFGVGTLISLSSGANNTALGVATLFSNTTGSNNTACGAGALNSNTTGGNNTAIGINALLLNTTGGNNTANGFEVLRANSSGINNTATGYQALLANTTGINNTAIGVIALDSNTIGDDNTAVGRGSLIDNIIGNSNTAIGKDALFNSTSNNNTAVGRGTLSGVTSGSNNTAIGFDVQVASGTASNQVRVGNTAVTSASVQVAWTITSDNRWKSNIQSSNLGLEFIKELNPVFYTRKDVAINDGKTTILETTSNPTNEYGFIAQELESTLNKI